MTMTDPACGTSRECGVAAAARELRAYVSEHGDAMAARAAVALVMLTGEAPNCVICGRVRPVGNFALCARCNDGYTTPPGSHATKIVVALDRLDTVRASRARPYTTARQWAHAGCIVHQIDPYAADAWADGLSAHGDASA